MYNGNLYLADARHLQWLVVVIRKSLMFLCDKISHNQRERIEVTKFSSVPPIGGGRDDEEPDAPT